MAVAILIVSIIIAVVSNFWVGLSAFVLLSLMFKDQIGATKLLGNVTTKLLGNSKQHDALGLDKQAGAQATSTAQGTAALDQAQAKAQKHKPEPASSSTYKQSDSKAQQSSASQAQNKGKARAFGFSFTKQQDEVKDFVCEKINTASKGQGGITLDDWLVRGIPLSAFGLNSIGGTYGSDCERRAMGPELAEIQYNLAYLEQQQIHAFYHFTELANLHSILGAQKIFSANNARHLGMSSSMEGSRSSRMHEGYNYVHLSFCKAHPMLFVSMREGRIKVPIILEIDPRVLLDSKGEYCFTDTNSTRSEVHLGKSRAFLEHKLDLSIFKRAYSEFNELEKRQYQAEIMLKYSMDARFIRRVYGVPGIKSQSYHQALLNYSQNLHLR